MKRLEALVALAREGTVSAAATALGCGQPTVSHHLRRLEEETGAVLVQRVGRGVRLTPDGVRLAARGEEILGLLRRAEAELDTMTTLAAGHVRLAAFPSACSTIVPKLLATLADTAPGLTFDIVEVEPPEAATLLRSGEVDVAITFAYSGQHFDGDVTVEHLGWDALHLAESSHSAGGRGAAGSASGVAGGDAPGVGAVHDEAPGAGVTGEGVPGVGAKSADAPGLELAHGHGETREAPREDSMWREGIVRPDASGAAGAGGAAALRPEVLRRLSNASWIAGCERCRTGLLDLCASVGVVPDIGFASDDVVAVQALVAAGFGVTLLPALALAGHRNPGVVTHPVVGAGRELHIATYGAPPRPAAVEEVVQTLLGLSWSA